MHNEKTLKKFRHKILEFQECFYSMYFSSPHITNIKSLTVIFFKRKSNRTIVISVFLKTFKKTLRYKECSWVKKILAQIIDDGPTLLNAELVDYSTLRLKDQNFMIRILNHFQVISRLVQTDGSLGHELDLSSNWIPDPGLVRICARCRS